MKKIVKIVKILSPVLQKNRTLLIYLSQVHHVQNTVTFQRKTDGEHSLYPGNFLLETLLCTAVVYLALKYLEKEMKTDSTCNDP